MDTCTRQPVDWADLRFAVFLGAISALALVLARSVPALQIERPTRDAIASVVTVGYIVSRARRQPEKLDAWGITTPVTMSMLFAGLGLLAVAVGTLAITSFWVGGRPDFDISLLARAIEYILSGFPQQFVLCSIGLASLATFPALRGTWRLPLAVGLVFSLGHFWAEKRVPGSVAPLQMLLTFPAGFFAAYYFLRFRSILPLTAIHAISYPLLVNWVEKYL